MRIFQTPFKNKKIIIALGAESCGNFSIYNNGEIFFSDDFGDLFDENNFKELQKSINVYLRKKHLKPDIIICDLHPLFKTVEWGRELAKKFNAEFFQVQHHRAHIFSAIGEYFLSLKPNCIFCFPSSITAIACDGTGYGLDGKIWGGEVFKILKIETGEISCKKKNLELREQDFFSCRKFSKQPFNFGIKRIGCLENQIMAGGDLAIKQPARMLISILQKFLKKEQVYNHVAKYYSSNEFEVLYNQIKQNFNCVETSSAGRVLDAVSVLLGFCPNNRAYKHESIKLLEKNSIFPRKFLKPEIEKIGDLNVLLTIPLFKYLIECLIAGKDRAALGGAAQAYIAEGLYNMAVDNFLEESREEGIVFAGGGLCDNEIICFYFKSRGVVMNKKISRGDAGISFGQAFYYLLANSRN